MNGLTTINELMKSIEREEIKRALIKEWYLLRNKTTKSKQLN